MKTKPLLGIVVGACLAFSGCGLMYIWHNPSVADAQAQQDLQMCQYDSVKYGYVHTSYYGNPFASGAAAGVARAFRETEIMNSCMQSKGYSLKRR
jgi:hypothetical protein